MGSRDRDSDHEGRHRRHNKTSRRSCYSKGRSSSTSESDSDDGRSKVKSKRSTSFKHSSSNKLTSRSSTKVTQRYYSKHTKSRRKSRSKSSSTSPERSNYRSRNHDDLASRKPPSNSKRASEKFESKSSIIIKTVENTELSRIRAIDDINADGFQSQAFISKKEIPENDMSNENFTFGTSGEKILEKAKPVPELTSSLMHPNLFANQEMRQDRWVKKLFILRQKSLQDL